jgi:hypothetical protein
MVKDRYYARTNPGQPVCSEVQEDRPFKLLHETFGSKVSKGNLVSFTGYGISSSNFVHVLSRPLV